MQVARMEMDSSERFQCLSQARMEFPMLLPTGGSFTPRPSDNMSVVGTPLASSTPAMSVTG